MPFTPPPGSDAERARFRELQERLTDQFLRFRADPRMPYTAVVIPSQSVDPIELAKIPGVGNYEERSLFNLMLLRQPRLHVVFVTSKRLDPLIVDYYLHQMRGVPSSHTRRRLTLLDCDDGSARPLTQKVLERPRLVERVRAAIGDVDNAHMAVFNATALERTLSVQLGIALNACDPDLVHLGSKTGSRRAFAAAGVPMAPGREGLTSVEDLVEGLADLWAEYPDLQRAVVKLDESFSGEGNAVADLSTLDPGQSIAARRAAVRRALPSLVFAAEGVDWDNYAAQFDAMGGVVEAWIEGKGKTSPSAQMRITPSHEVQAVSTHDQVLGGPSGQVFLGATFPAARRYRREIQDLGAKVGSVLASQGVIGRFAVDFVAVPRGEGADLYAVEINLRQGGTTHPFNTLKFLTDGTYDEQSGTFRTAQGQPRCYFATDTLSDPRYKGILPFDLIDQLVLHGVQFRSDETGLVFHLLGCLSEHGKLGCTAIAHTVPEARALYATTVDLLDRLAGKGTL